MECFLAFPLLSRELANSLLVSIPLTTSLLVGGRAAPSRTGAHGAQDLVRAMRDSPSLTELRLNSNDNGSGRKLSDETAERIAAMLGNPPLVHANGGMRAIGLSGSDITNRGAALLATALHKKHNPDDPYGVGGAGSRSTFLGRVGRRLLRRPPPPPPVPAFRMPSTTAAVLPASLTMQRLELAGCPGITDFKIKFRIEEALARNRAAAQALGEEAARDRLVVPPAEAAAAGGGGAAAEAAGGHGTDDGALSLGVAAAAASSSSREVAGGDNGVCSGGGPVAAVIAVSVVAACAPAGAVAAASSDRRGSSTSSSSSSSSSSDDDADEVEDEQKTSLDESFFGQDGDRKFSVMSREAIETLHSPARQILSMAERCSEFSAQIPTLAAASLELKHFRSELAQLHGNVDQLQFNKIDTVMTGPLTSGKAQAKAQRKALTKQCIALGKRIEVVNKQLEERIGGGAGAELPPLELPAFPVPAEEDD